MVGAKLQRRPHVAAADNALPLGVVAADVVVFVHEHHVAALVPPLAQDVGVPPGQGDGHHRLSGLLVHPGAEGRQQLPFDGVEPVRAALGVDRDVEAAPAQVRLGAGPVDLIVRQPILILRHRRLAFPQHQEARVAEELAHVDHAHVRVGPVVGQHADVDVVSGQCRLGLLHLGDNPVPDPVRLPEHLHVLLLAGRVEARADRIDIRQVDVVQVVVQVPMAGEVGAVPFRQHVVAHVRKPVALVRTLLQSRGEVGHARGIGDHRGMFLVRAEPLPQQILQFRIPVAVTVQVGNLAAVELEVVAPGIQFHDLEPQGGFDAAVRHREVVHQPVRPFTESCRGRDAVAVLPVYQMNPVVLLGGCGHQHGVASGGVAEPGHDFDFRLQRRLVARRQIPPVDRHGQPGDALNAPGTCHRGAVMANHEVVAAGACYVGLAGGHLELGMGMARVPQPVQDGAGRGARGEGPRVVQGRALQTGPFQRVPYPVGAVAASVETVDVLARGQRGLPSGHLVGSRVRPGGQRGPVGGGPDRKGTESLVVGAFRHQTGERRQGTLPGKIPDHGQDEAVHAKCIHSFRHGRPLSPLKMRTVPERLLPDCVTNPRSTPYHHYRGPAGQPIPRGGTTSRPPTDRADTPRVTWRVWPCPDWKPGPTIPPTAARRVRRAVPSSCTFAFADTMKASGKRHRPDLARGARTSLVLTTKETIRPCLCN